MSFTITEKLLKAILNNELKHVLNEEDINNLTYNVIIQLDNKHASIPQIKSKDENELIFFTDGAVNGNGKKENPIAGVGIYNMKFEISKRFNNVKFRFNDKDNKLSNPNKSIIYKASNIRAEGYAILYTLWLIKLIHIDNKQITERQLSKLNKLEYLFPFDTLDMREIINDIKIINKTKKMAIIVTDSEFWINMIETFIPKWVQANIVTTKKNIDLVVYIEYIYRLLEKNNVNVILRHVRSHPNKKKQLNDDEIGNEHADKLAVNAKQFNHTNFIFNIL